MVRGKSLDRATVDQMTIPIADTLDIDIEVEVNKDRVVFSGSTDRWVIAEVLGEEFPWCLEVEIASSVVNLPDQFAAVLCEGGGDLGLAVLCDRKLGKLRAYVCDLSVLTTSPINMFERYLAKTARGVDKILEGAVVECYGCDYPVGFDGEVAWEKLEVPKSDGTGNTKLPTKKNNLSLPYGLKINNVLTK